MINYYYKPTTWIGGKTVATADVLNNIEEGITIAHENLKEVIAKFNKVKQLVDENVAVDDINYILNKLQEVEVLTTNE